MKKIIGAILLAILLVSCGGGGGIDDPVKPQKESLVESVEEYKNLKGVPTKSLDGYSVTLSNATVIGIEAEAVDNPGFVTKAATPETKNYIVVSTSSTIDPNSPEYDKSSLTKVSFTKTDTEEFLEETYGSDDLIALSDTAQPEVKVKKQSKNESKDITIEAIQGHKYIVCAPDGTRMCEWVNPNSNGSYTFKDVKTDVNVDYYVKDVTSDAFLTFNAKEGFTYSIYNGDSCVVDEIKDNDTNDLNEEAGKIKVGGLEDGKTYEVRYYKVESGTKIEQTEINGEIDKLYVLGDFTFVSYVPEGSSARPKTLEYDVDGIAKYDKKDYFSSNTRQSFVISNSTGLIYPIVNQKIDQIVGGCLDLNGDTYLYDFKINNSNELEIYSLFTNNEVNWDYCFKDKYGHVYIHNYPVDYSDSKITMWTWPKNDGYSTAQVEGYDYLLTTSGDVLKVKIGNGINNGITETYVMNSDFSTRPLTDSDNYEIVYYSEGRKSEKRVVSVKSGVVYWCDHRKFDSQTYSDWYNFFGLCTIGKYDAINNKTYVVYMHDNKCYDAEYISDGILIVYDIASSTLGYATDIFELLDSTSFSYDTYNDYYYVPSSSWPELGLTNLLQECDLDSKYCYVLKFSPSGTTSYRIVAEDDNGTMVVKTYEASSYIEPQKVFYLQPLNK